MHYFLSSSVSGEMIVIAGVAALEKIYTLPHQMKYDSVARQILHPVRNLLFLP